MQLYWISQKGMESLPLIIVGFLMKCCLKLTLLWLIWFSGAPRSSRQLSFACRQFEILVGVLGSHFGTGQTFLFMCKVHKKTNCVRARACVCLADDVRWDDKRKDGTTKEDSDRINYCDVKLQNWSWTRANVMRFKSHCALKWILKCCLQWEAAAKTDSAL